MSFTLVFCLENNTELEEVNSNVRVKRVLRHWKGRKFIDELMDFFEAPSWDGDEATEKLTADLFHSPKVSLVQVAKKRKRNKYPKNCEVNKHSRQLSPHKGTQGKTAAGRRNGPFTGDELPHETDNVSFLNQKSKRKCRELLKQGNEKQAGCNGIKAEKKKLKSMLSKNSRERISVISPSNLGTGSGPSPSSPVKHKNKKKRHKKVSAQSQSENETNSHSLKHLKNKLDLNVRIGSLDNDKADTNDFHENTCKPTSGAINFEGDLKQQTPYFKSEKSKIKSSATSNFGSKNVPVFPILKKNQEHHENCLPLKKTSKMKETNKTHSSATSYVKEIKGALIAKKRKHSGNIESAVKMKKSRKEVDPVSFHDTTEEMAHTSTNLGNNKEGNLVITGGTKNTVGLHDGSSMVSKKKNLSLRERMMEKLRAARFRFLNEQMYNSKSEDTSKLFQVDQGSFGAYHEGYKQQLSQWPVKPVNLIINSLKMRPASYIIADFGCGDAQIAQSLPNEVHSFDHVALNEYVTVCDMAHTPLSSRSVDVVVFCLSLMGKNLSDYILEANRVLKIGGTMKIAEVESRFDDVEKFIKIVSKFGFLCIHRNLSNNVFYLFDFKKEKQLKDGKNLPTLELRACSYKKR